jgi:hypothetical protein
LYRHAVECLWRRRPLRADPAALAALERFETSGHLDVPVVTPHTTGDPFVPFSQSSLCPAKVSAARASARLTAIPVVRHGHCTFEAPEVLGAFTTLWDRIPDQPAALASALGQP